MLCLMLGCSNTEPRTMTSIHPDFGEEAFNEIDAWDCRVVHDFPHLKTTEFAIHVWADERGPTENQQACFNTLKSKYNELWPQIANKMIGCHDQLETIVIDLDLPNEGTRGYFIPVEDWFIGDVVIAD